MVQEGTDASYLVLLSKHTRPSSDGSVLRHRLFARMDEGMGMPITWVSGPGGCGKTTLVSSYAETRKSPVLWYQADGGDEDLATFFYHLGLADNRNPTSPSQPLPLLTAEYLLGTAEFSRNFFGLLYDRLEPQTVLVVDNMQEVQYGAPLYDAILQGLSRIRNGIRLILVSRSGPPPSYVHLRANRLMHVLGWQDLRLTFDEFEEIIKREGFEYLPNDTTRGLYSLLDGWAAGLQLILADARVHDLDLKGGETWSREEIFDYFGSQILEGLDPSTQEFLLKTCTLPQMTAKMAQELTGHASAARLLANLHRRNLFTEKRSLKSEAYQYHPLFREFLTTRARELFSDKELIDVQTCAAKLLLESGHTEDAFGLLAEAGAWDDVERLIIQHAPSLMAQGRHRVLEEWLCRLPEERLTNSPWLLYYRGACRIPYNLQESRAYLTKAYSLFKTHQDTIGLFLAWTDIVTSISAEYDDFAQLDQWIREVETLLSEFPLPSTPEVQARVIISLFSALTYRQPHHPDMALWMERMECLTEEAKDLHLRLTAGSKLVIYYSFVGAFSKAGRILNLLKHLARSETTPTFFALDWLHNEVTYLWLSGSHDRSIELLFEALELAKESGIMIFNPPLYALGVFVSHGRGDSKTAGKFLDKMTLEMSSCGMNERARLHYCQALLLSSSGSLVDAAEMARTAMEPITKSGFPFSIGFCSIAMGHLLTELGKYDEAAVHLEKAGEIGLSGRSYHIQHPYLLYSSYLALRKADEEIGVDLLQKAMAMGREKRFFSLCWWQPAVMTFLCMKALENNIEIPYVQELISRRGLAPDVPPLEIESWPWPIKIFTLGRFELVVKDHTTRTSDKARQRPLALLKALIALGGRNVRESEIADALWPDSDGDLAHRSFATTLHRLRQLLELPEAIRLRGGRLTLNDRYCWVDAWAMERMFSQAETARQEDISQPASPSVKLAEKAINLYKGMFLPRDVDEPWTIHRRERLHSKFLRGVEVLGRRLERAGQWDDAVRQYSKALEVDPVAEIFYRRLMSCLQELGRNTEALAVYSRCREMLETTLGLEPSPETEALRRNLQSH